MSAGHAAAGGEIGVNGEDYKGGQFLPSSAKTVKGAKRRPLVTGKKPIGPYLWAAQPAPDMVSIYDRINLYCTDNRRECEYTKGQGFAGLRLIPRDEELDTDFQETWPSDTPPGVRYLGDGHYERVLRPFRDRGFFAWVVAWADKYNAGERWAPIADDLAHYANPDKDACRAKYAALAAGVGV